MPTLLTWVQKGTSYYAAPYRLHPTSIGWDLWIWGKDRQYRVHQNVATLERAKRLADEHKTRNSRKW